MQFSHRADAARLALVEELDPAVVLRWDDPAGKRRKKTIRKAHLGQARHAALRFLFKEGFVLRAQPSGPLRWLTQTEERYPHGHPFALGPDGVWVADTGWLRCVTPGTCAQRDVSIGAEIMPRSVGVGGGRVISVIDMGSGGGGTPPFRAPSRGRLAYGILALDGDRLTQLAEVPHTPDAKIVDGASVARDGRFVGPCAEGVGLYVDGVLTDRWPVGKAAYWSPKADISPSGAWIAMLAPDGAIRIEGPERRVVSAGLKQLVGLMVDDAGVAWAQGIGPAFWGLYRVGTSAERVHDDHAATPAPDGQSVVSVKYGRVTHCDLAGETLRSVDAVWLGMAKTGRGAWRDADTVIVRTDAHTLAEIDLSAGDS